jgi:hypothetical protein
MILGVSSGTNRTLAEKLYFFTMDSFISYLEPFVELNLYSGVIALYIVAYCLSDIETPPQPKNSTTLLFSVPDLLHEGLVQLVASPDDSPCQSWLVHVLHKPIEGKG